jgi:hypothetical protein
MAGTRGKGQGRAAESISDEHGLDGDKGVAKQPSLRQQRVLDKFYELPNAAAVARDLGMSERQVRRIIDEFRPLLDERWHREKRETADRAAARHAKLTAWAHVAQQENLEALDVLVRSPDETVRLRAIKLRQDMIDHVMPPSAPMSEVDIELIESERRALEALRRVQLEAVLDDRIELGGS